MIAPDERRRVRERRRDLAVHVALYVVVNAIYLTLAWPEWWWVTAIWGAGLAVHALLVGQAGRRRPDPSSQVGATNAP